MENVSRSGLLLWDRTTLKSVRSGPVLVPRSGPASLLEMEEEDDDQEEKDEEPKGTNDTPEAPCRNPGRNRQLPKRFRQNVANVSKLIQGQNDKTPE